MYVRCPDCFASTWAKPFAGGASRFVCSGCRRRDDIDWLNAGSSEAAHLARTRQVAERERLDLPSAYSIALGVMTAERAREALQNPGALESSRQRLVVAPKPAVRNAEGNRAQYAAQRDIDAIAKHLARKYDIPLARALQVASYRISLAEAVAMSGGPSPGSAAPLARSWRKRRWSWREKTLAAIAVSALIFLAFDSVSEMFAANERIHAEEDHARQTRLLRAAKIVRDQEGRLVKIAGPDPRNVVVGLSHALAAERTLAPLEIRTASPDLRIGIVEDTELGQQLAVEIRRTGMQTWEVSASNGSVRLVPPPTFAPGTPRARI